MSGVAPSDVGRRASLHFSWTEHCLERSLSDTHALPHSRTPGDVVLANLERLSTELQAFVQFDRSHPRTMTGLVRKTGYYCERSFAANSPIHSLSVSDDGRLAIGLRNKRVLLTSCRDPIEGLELTSHSGSLCCVELLPAGRLVTSSMDCSTLVWAPGKDGALEATPIPWAKRQVNSFQILPGDRLVAACDDGVVRIGHFQGEACEELRTVSSGPLAPVHCVLALRDGRILAGRDDGAVAQWSLAHRSSQVTGFMVDSSRLINAIGVLSSGAVLTGGTSDGLLLHRFSPGSHASSHRLSPNGAGWVTCLQVLPDDDVVFGTTQGVVWRYSTETGLCEALYDSEGIIRAVQMMPDGRIFVGGDKGTVYVLDGEPVGRGNGC